MLPAYAGMILDEMGYTCARPRAPRVCRDDPAGQSCDVHHSGVLPAYAGMIHGSTR